MSVDKYAARSSVTTARKGTVGSEIRGYGFSTSETDICAVRKLKKLEVGALSSFYDIPGW